MNYLENIKEIRNFAKEINIDEKYLLGEEWKGNLLLSTVKTLPDNIVFNVGGSLYLPSVKSIHSSVQFVSHDELFLPFDGKVKVIWS